LLPAFPAKPLERGLRSEVLKPFLTDRAMGEHLSESILQPLSRPKRGDEMAGGYRGSIVANLTNRPQQSASRRISAAIDGCPQRSDVELGTCFTFP
jgi:hypothetical protein